MARPDAALASATTVHCPTAPLPVRAKSKSAGAAPGVIRSRSIVTAPVWASAAAAQASAPTANAAVKRDEIEWKFGDRFRFMRNLLDASSAAQSLDGIAVSRGACVSPHTYCMRQDRGEQSASRAGAR